MDRDIKILCFALLLIGWNFVAIPADAADIEYTISNTRYRVKESYPIFLVRGKIRAGDSEKFKRVYDSVTNSRDDVWFDSVGGDMTEGFKLGRLIRSLRLATRVPTGAECASACTNAFMGGVLRFADQGARIGVHMFSPKSTDAQVRETAQKFAASRGTSETHVVMQYGAGVLSKWVSYLEEMGISPRLAYPAINTSTDEMRWLTRREMIDYYVLNVPE